MVDVVTADWLSFKNFRIIQTASEVDILRVVSRQMA